MTSFNYTAPAELYSGKGRSRFRHMRYRRFDSAAAALRYSIEEMPKDLLADAVLEVDERRYDGKQLRAHYDDAAYPLSRCATRAASPA